MELANDALNGAFKQVTEAKKRGPLKSDTKKREELISSLQPHVRKFLANAGQVDTEKMQKGVQDLQVLRQKWKSVAEKIGDEIHEWEKVEDEAKKDLKMLKKL